MANFHVDSSGNLWIGTSSSNTFSTAQNANVPFYVTSAGAIQANSGTIGGNTLTSSSIKSSNYSSGSDGWIINSDGSAEFESVEIRIAASAESSEDDIPPGSKHIKIGAVPVYDYNGHLNFHPASGKSVIIHNGNPFVIKGETGSAQMKFEGAGSIGDFLFDLDFVSWSSAQSDNTRRYSNPSPLTQIREFYFENENTIIFRANEQNADVEFMGDIGMPSNSFLYINGDNGSNGEVLTRTATGMEWATASSGSHDHDSSYSATGHTHSYDNYDHWDVNGMQMDSGFGLTIQAGTGISVSNSSSPHTITIANTATGLSSAVQGINGNTSSQHYFSTSGTGFFSQSDMDGSSSTHSFTFSSTMPSAASITTGHVLPNGTKNIGGFGTYWDYVYYNNLSGSSDERKKNSIEDIDVGLDFINTLKPRKFKWNVDENIECNTCGQTLETVGDDCTADNCEGEAFDSNLDRADDLQYGFIAQETLPLMPDSEQDYGLVNYKDDVDEYVMSYTSMVAPLVKAVQELSTQISDLTARVEALEG